MSETMRACGKFGKEVAKLFVQVESLYRVGFDLGPYGVVRASERRYPVVYRVEYSHVSKMWYLVDVRTGKQVLAMASRGIKKFLHGWILMGEQIKKPVI